MKKNIKETILTCTEKTILSKAKLLYWLYFLFEFIFIIYETRVIKLGAYHIGIVLASVSSLVIIALAYVMMFFKKVKFIKTHHKIFLVNLIAIFIITVYNIFVGGVYICDIIGGTAKTITNEYNVTNTQNLLEFIDSGGRKVSIRVSDEMKNRLNHNELISHSFEEYFSNNELYYHKEEIRLIYYPHSNILVQIDFDK